MSFLWQFSVKITENSWQYRAFVSHSPVTSYRFLEVPGTDFYDKNMVNSWSMYGIPAAL
ncbi:hypothetical protein [Nostoc sp. LEGE 12450]|uniref:hypothetical protein n=1 Tax=Nostoc sp. LEGE 12450 TaxID=1828643 RepID=UPI001882DEAF|nr:hypothetical protein [Nostoc sp. LEGE 12450]MBE8988805.1 hypothetical protein [Nostoc sp. LEGE 12450]